jgi:hypothetical protein
MRGFTNFDAELEEFTMDAGSAPQRVGEARGADQLADFERLLATIANLIQAGCEKVWQYPLGNSSRLSGD